MSDFERDDAPSAFRLDRRHMLVGGALVIANQAFASDALAAQGDLGSGLPTSKFMRLSGLLIAHHLNSQVGARLAAALGELHPDLEQDIDRLMAIATARNATIVEDFFPDIPDGKLKDTALMIISAWYMGVIVDAPGAEVFAYELALMYQPTKDVMTLPSYAISGPNGWNSSSPPLSDMPVF